MSLTGPASLLNGNADGIFRGSVTLKGGVSVGLRI